MYRKGLGHERNLHCRKESVSKEKKVVEKSHFDKLTYANIDKLQNYYGIAVRSDSNDLAGMQKAIRATLYHVASSESNHNHSESPLDETKLVPIDMELLSDELLSKCLHGKTQNQNESFNATIWERLPKTKYNSFTHLDVF